METRCEYVIFETGGEESVLVIINAKELHSVNLITQRLAHVLRKFDKESELFETREETKELMIERVKTNAEGWMVSDTVGCKAASGARSSKSEVRYLGRFEVGVGQRVSPGNQSSMSSADGSQKKRKAAVRKNQPKHRNTNRASRTAWRWTWTRTRRS